MLPSLFISHGSPEIAILNNATSQFLKKLPSLFSKPKFVLVISAHWVTNNLHIISNEQPNIEYDFYGFNEKLYEIQYPIQNNQSKVKEIQELFLSQGIHIENDSNKNYDHGVWIPLKLMYPNADIPVIQLSLPINWSIKQLIKLGEILRPLKKDTLIITSGSMTHNLQDINWGDINAPVKTYASTFRNWMVETLQKADVKKITDFINLAPFVRENHPTLEHILPLFIALGASTTHIAEALNDVYMYGNQSMDTLIFKE